jgi:hypothetical protein
MPILTVRYRYFSPTNMDLPGGFSINVTPNQTASITAPPLAIPDPAHPGQYINYSFLFWNIIGADVGVTTNNPVNIVLASNDITATAWYVQVGGDGPTPVGVYTFTFSETDDQVWPDSAIQSVSPAAAWAGGNNTFVATGASAVDITPKNEIAGHAGQVFDMWTLFGPGTVSGTILHVNKNTTVWAIANYKVPANPPSYPPDWWKLVKELRDAREIIDKIVLIADPPPEDLVRLKDKLTRAAEQPSPVDELTNIVTSIDKMSVAQIRASLAEIQANISRLQAARRIADEALKKIEKGK